VALEPKVFLIRPKIEPPLIGEIPENAVPKLTETAHLGAPDVNPRLPSNARLIGPSTTNATPPATERARRAAESGVRISAL